MPSFSRVGALAAVAACALAAVGAHAADEPPCPTISLEGIEQLAAPCADASNACSMKTGCIGAIQEYIEPRLDLSVFKSQPSEEYVTGCIAPFALSPEVTETIPTDTLGTLITCDFTEVTDAFRSKWERDVAKAAEKGEDATKVSEAADDAEDVTDDAAAPSPAPM